MNLYIDFYIIILLKSYTLLTSPRLYKCLTLTSYFLILCIVLKQSLIPYDPRPAVHSSRASGRDQVYKSESGHINSVIIKLRAISKSASVSQATEGRHAEDDNVQPSLPG